MDQWRGPFKSLHGNLVGLPVIVLPTGFKNIPKPPSNGTRRRTTITTGIYAPPQKDHIALALAMAYQSVTDHHRQRPPINDLGSHDVLPDPPKVNYPPRIGIFRKWINHAYRFGAAADLSLCLLL
ncbi:hypothetical protein Syun_024667 [Stephania yunnanensis]|uniref:Amidase domain-containing protein n=1 Tax=Stephania yunnanensis TaxID=152371 RepID=A0AAP0NL37_9MAGN